MSAFGFEFEWSAEELRLLAAPALRSREETKNWFEQNGISICEWAREHGVDRYVVFDLLRGKRKGRRGQAHKVAVMLGLKADPRGKEHAQ